MRLVVMAGFIALCFNYRELRAQGIVQFRLSKPYCLLNFLETCNDGNNTSSTLKRFAEKHDLLKDTAFTALLRSYRNIELSYTYNRDQFPEHRIRSRYGNTMDLLIIAAVNSDNLDQFRNKTIGILPNSDHVLLFDLLSKAELYYNDLIWNPYAEQINSHLEALKPYQSRIEGLFKRLNYFYRSSWTADIPFVVTIYPVPGFTGNTTATPHVNSLCVGVLTGAHDYDGIAGVILHEMCHSLYNEQSAQVQQMLEQLFMKDSSLFRSFAYTYFDEGLATACGNGWARELFNGKMDSGEWYNDKYIDAFGHALYAPVKEYLNSGKNIDSLFISNAIREFGTLFPKAPYDYNLLFNSINVYSDAEEQDKIQKLNAALYENFRISSRSSSSPLLDNTSLEMLRENDGTQVVVIYKNHEKSLLKMKEIFPKLDFLLSGKNDPEYILSFYDSKKRPIILVNARSVERVVKAFEILQNQKYYDPLKPYRSFW